MTDKAWPREADATMAVEAAAKAYYDSVSKAPDAPAWDDLDVMVKLDVRNAVLSVVWAALKALPDPRHGAFLEGYDKAWRNWTGDHAAIVPNPYESGI